MSVLPPPGRPDMRLDLTRWNRRGLTRFAYVDANAATLLEELRIAALGLFLRGRADDDRFPEVWRETFRREPTDPLPQAQTGMKGDLDWPALWIDFPADAEDLRQRETRLLKQYVIKSDDYGWELLRAAARAAHVLLGYVNAYQNEGYLRTATQWDEIRRLAAMVNYQPTPPASAVATVALILDEAAGLIEVDRGLAMKHAPAEGGPPLIFETIEPVTTHAALNGVRVAGWDRDITALSVNAPIDWITPKKAELAPGSIAVLARTGGAPAAEVMTITAVEREEGAEQARLELGGVAAGAWIAADTTLSVEPEAVAAGLPRARAGVVVLKVGNPSAYPVGSIAIVQDMAGVDLDKAVVLAAASGFVQLRTTVPLPASVQLAAMTPFVTAPGTTYTGPSVAHLWFRVGDTVVYRGGTSYSVAGNTVYYYYATPPGAGPLAYAIPSPLALQTATLAGLAPQVANEPAYAQARTVRFNGKPPKGLEAGDWYAARGAQTRALRVERVHQVEGGYYVEFDQDTPGEPDAVEFHGPMRHVLRPVDYDRSREPIVQNGAVTLIELPEDALALLRRGKHVVLELETEEPPLAALAVADAVEVNGATAALNLTGLEGADFAGWPAGWTRLRFNVVKTSHGETKGPKTLGSGDGEKNRQWFPIDVTDVSFVPSPASETGVVPDIEVAVNGVKWAYRDYADATAEETETYSVTLREDDTLALYFRRRLPTGTNNVVLTRHRVGVGAAGSLVPARAFDKPMRKHAWVKEIVQPFPAAGGAPREPVESIRDNAPARLAANDRAVSLEDFERLASRHASIRTAKAREVFTSAPDPAVEVVVAPVGGAPTTQALREELIFFLESRSAPGVKVSIADYVPVPLLIDAVIHVDSSRYDPGVVVPAAETALLVAFDLERRNLGQPAYLSEALAALDRVAGVSSSTAQLTIAPGSAAPRRVAPAAGAISAIYPEDEQIAAVMAASSIVIQVEPVQ